MNNLKEIRRFLLNLLYRKKKMGCTSGSWDVQTYLNANPNISQAAANDKYSSRYNHYIQAVIAVNHTRNLSEWRVRLPASNFLAFLDVPFDSIEQPFSTHTEIANAIRSAPLTSAELTKAYAGIADIVDHGHLLYDDRLDTSACSELIYFDSNGQHANETQGSPTSLNHSNAVSPIANKQKSEAPMRIELSIDGLLAALDIPVEDIEKILLRPIDIIHGFVAQNIAAKKKLAHVYADIAHVMSYRGQPTLAEAYFRRSISITPDIQLHDRLFHAMMMSPDTTNEAMFDEARNWARLYSPHLIQRSFDLDSDPERRLRIGYVCSFFYELGTRIYHLPIMLGHDRNRFEIVAYSDSDVEDTLKVADIWRSTGNLNDDAFARLVLDDRIDILVEFNGRGGHNRFNAFAQRIAPVQINCGNFMATTGMPQVDYTIAANIGVLPEEERFYTEKICRLKAISIDYEQCWQEGFFPPVATSPYRVAGLITFGCFGASVKVHEQLIQTWCEIVKRVEGARFYYKSMSMSDPGSMECFRLMFERHGITGDRLILDGGSDHRTMLELYGKVDIALDTFPYSGGNTTLETLWQGIPVVTFNGNRWASRTGTALLSLADFKTFIAQSREEYIEIAVHLASNHDLRDKFRANVRDKIKQSPLTDMPESINELESKYRSMWRDWLNQE
jgi:hypothetical protein